VPNLTEASSNLYELIKGRNLAVYRDDAIRLAVSRAVALETPRGWRIAKEKASHKIDVVVALAQAALGAVCGGQISAPSMLQFYRFEVARRLVEHEGKSLEAAARAAAASVEELSRWISSSKSRGDALIKTYRDRVACLSQSSPSRSAASNLFMRGWPGPGW
jgi:hypothetical protein